MVLNGPLTPHPAAVGCSGSLWEPWSLRHRRWGDIRMSCPPRVCAQGPHAAPQVGAFLGQGHPCSQVPRLPGERGDRGRSTSSFPPESEADQGPGCGPERGLWGGSQRFGTPFWGEMMKAGPGSSKHPDLKPGRVLGLTAPPMPGSEWGPRDLGPQPGGGAAALGTHGGGTPPQAFPPAVQWRKAPLHPALSSWGRVGQGCSWSCPHSEGGASGGQWALTTPGAWGPGWGGCCLSQGEGRWRGAGVGPAQPLV